MERTIFMDILKGLNLNDTEPIKNSLSDLWPYLKAIKYVQPICHKIKTSIQKPKVAHYDINEIFKNVKNGNINIDDVIFTSGYMLSYGQIFKPYTHVNGVIGNCKNKGKREVYKNGRKSTEYVMDMEYKIFQPPIQKLPSYNGTGCAFLYDKEFKGFIHKENPEKLKENKSIIIEDYSKPIFVLYDLKKHTKFLNKEVKLKARVTNMPPELISRMNGIFDENISNICSNFIDRYSENINFICLVVFDEDTTINNEKDIENIYEFEAPIYTEFELNKFNKYYSDSEMATDIIAEILPNLPQRLEPNFPLKIITESNNYGTPFVSTNNINVVFREPNVIGFYTNVRIYNQIEYTSKLEEYIQFVNNFKIDYKNIMNRKFNIKASTKLNFLFDYEKQFLLDSRGALYVNSNEDNYHLDESESYVQEWLKNENDKG